MLNYQRYKRVPVVDFPERTWPNKEIMKAPIWCSVDLRDGNQALVEFADQLDASCLETMEAGYMTKDLALLCDDITPTVLNSLDFIRQIRRTLEAKRA